MADRASKAVLLSKDDGFSGYYQWRLAEESKHITGVWTPLGPRVFNCMPMGINVAPAKWNEAMVRTFGDLPGDRYFGLMDDFMRFTPQNPGETRADVERNHLDELDEFLRRVEAVHLKLKIGKAAHGREQISALGLMFGHGKVWKTDETTQVLRDYPVPRSAKQLEKFLALGNYYGHFVDNYSKLAQQLRPLARLPRWPKDALGEGTRERQIFEQIRLELAEEVKLQMPDWEKRFILKTDWSCEAVAAALIQKDDNGRLRPVGFASRKCTEAEAKLGAPDGEMVALVWGVKRFEKYLLGRQFDAYVDQGSLSWLKDKRLSSINDRRLQGAFAYLRQFDFVLHYLKADKMRGR